MFKDMPFNRFVAFVKPYLNVLAGAIAALLVAKANVLGIKGLDEANTATWIAGALAWLLTQGATQLGDNKWLKGHHITLVNEAAVATAAIAAESAAGAPVVDLEAAVADASVPDEVELSRPPTQPSQDDVL